MRNDTNEGIFLYVNEGGFTPGTYRHLTVRLSEDEDADWSMKEPSAEERPKEKPARG